MNRHSYEPEDPEVAAYTRSKDSAQRFLGRPLLDQEITVLQGWNRWPHCTLADAIFAVAINDLWCLAIWKEPEYSLRNLVRSMAERARVDDEFAASIEALFRLGGPDAVSRMVRESMPRTV